MLHGPVMKQLFLFSVPLILTNWLQMLFSSADSMIVGKWAGSAALAAVGASFPFVMTVIMLFAGMAAGVSVCAANDYGAGDERGLEDTLHTSLLLSFLIGIFVLFLGRFLARPLMNLLSTPDDVIDNSVLYIKIYFLCMPAQLVYSFGSAVIRATGNSRHPLIFLAISGFLNLLLNMLFVIAFHWDVTGVAAATVITQYLSAVLVIQFLIRQKSPCTLHLKKLVLKKEKLQKIIRIGLPAGLQSAILASSDMPLQFAVNSLGSLAVSGNAAALNIDGAVFTTIDAMCTGCTVFTGQNAGARLFSRMKHVLRDSMILTFSLALIMGLVGFIFRHQILGLFLPNAAEAVVFGASRVSIVSTTCFIYAILGILNASLRGYGISTAPAVITLIGIVGFRYAWVAAYMSITEQPTMFGLYLSFPLAWLVCIAVTALLYGRITRKVRDKALAA